LGTRRFGVKAFWAACGGAQGWTRGRAFEAVAQVAKKGVHVIPEVMIPLTGNVAELANQRAIVVRVAEEVLGKAGLQDQKYMVGTMIEIPRAALTADEVAREADFFSYGTNDLTQTALGFRVTTT